MWLGIVLHAIIVYKTEPETNWPHDPTGNSEFLDWLYQFIHYFRMPLFFMVAGFFARFVIHKSGEKYFVRQRIRRILIPFVVGVILLVPISLFPFNYYKFHFIQQLNTGEALKESLLQMFHWNGLLHLWFLYYLIIFYAFSLSVKFLMQQTGIKISPMLHAKVARISALKILPVVLGLFLILFSFGAFLPPVYTGIKPNLFYFLYYGLFFFSGWVLQINMKSVNSLTRFAWVYFIVGTGLSVLHFFRPDLFDNMAGYLLISVLTISLVVGITGLFIKYCNADSKRWRYFSDTAYWVYLVHVSIVVTCQVWLLDKPISGWLKLSLVLGITFALSLLSYKYLVRHTIIGRYLHGEREKKDKRVRSGLTLRGEKLA